MPGLWIDGTTLDYIEYGRGDPVVFVHGSASDRRTWEVPLREFALHELRPHFRVISYSRRFHWPNAPIPSGADYSMPDHVADLERLLETLAVAPAHLVGHSYGAFVCLLLTIVKPELVRSLVLAEPPVLTLFTSNHPTPQEILRVLLTRPRAALAIVKFGTRGVGPAIAALRRGQPEAALRCFGTAVLGGPAFRRLSAARLRQAQDNFMPEELLGSGFPQLTVDQVRAVRNPTLLVTAERSPRLFHRFAERLEELLPHAERAEIRAASHIMHEDNPRAYCTAVLRFLQRMPPLATRVFADRFSGEGTTGTVTTTLASRP